MKHHFLSRVSGVITAVALLVPTIVLAAMSGSEYTIYADSVSVGGVGLSTTTNYSLEGTVGEPVAGNSSSSGYEVRAGFQSMQREDLSLTLSSSDLSLGELDKNTVKSASTNATVTSNALSGYSLQIDSVSGNITATVNDGEVSTAQDEYGFSVSGNEAAFSGDKAVAAGRVVASASGERYNSVTTLTFKGSRSDAAVAGTYSQTITLLLSANF